MLGHRYLGIQHLLHLLEPATLEIKLVYRSLLTMPLHLPHIGHTRSSSHSSDSRPPESFVPTSPGSPRTASRVPIQPHRQGTTASFATTSSTSSSNTASSIPPPAPPSILRKTPTPQSSISSSDMTGSSTSGSAYVTKKMNNLAFDRTDTIASTIDSDDDDDEASTPATSVSSLTAQCPLPTSSATQKFPFFVMTLSSTSTLTFIALPVADEADGLDGRQQGVEKGNPEERQCGLCSSVDAVAQR